MTKDKFFQVIGVAPLFVYFILIKSVAISWIYQLLILAIVISLSIFAIYSRNKGDKKIKTSQFTIFSIAIIATLLISGFFTLNK